MNELMNAGNVITMSSLELLEVINNVRKEFDEPIVENSHFLKRVEDELDVELGKRNVFRKPRWWPPWRILRPNNRTMYSCWYA